MVLTYKVSVQKLFLKAFLSIIFLCVTHPSFAQEDNLSLITKSEYFSVYGPKSLDKTALLGKLDFDYFLQPSTVYEKYDPAQQNPNAILAKTFDALFLKVSDIIDIHVYTFHGTIKVFPNRESVNAAYRRIFNKDFHERSFYLPQKNTIYISFSDMTLGMIGHEIAHAIIARYFVVPPPEKVQEILAGYVEYGLRKSRGTL